MLDGPRNAIERDDRSTGDDNARGRYSSSWQDQIPSQRSRPKFHEMLPPGKTPDTSRPS